MNKTDWNAVRAKFPVCNRVIYLNAAGGAPMCAEASVEGKRYFDEMLLYGDTCWDEWLQRVDRVRNKLADFIGAPREGMAFAPNTSMAMGMIAHLLKGYGKVLTMDDEFPSSTLPWMNLGYPVDFVPSEAGAYSIRSIERQIQPEHRILVASIVQYKTGFRQNLAELGKFCKSADLILVVNATQGMGVFPLDATENGIEFLTFSGLKWACAGYGAAGLFVHPKYLSGNTIPFAGWRSVESPEKMDNRLLQLRCEASALEAGSPSFPAIFALGGALDLLTEIGQEDCMNRILHLSRYLEQRLRKYNFTVMYAFGDANRSGIVMIKSPNAKAWVHELAEKGIMVSARGEGLRVSVHIYNNESDIDHFVAELDKMRDFGK
jgi:selenocysteine lyase/cysteine desulfurase